MLAVRLVPPNVMAEHRAAAETSQSKPVSRVGVVVVVSLWLAAAAALTWWLWPTAA